MKKKFGFTLAEVLITLGIVGVVAALTAPALVKNSGQAKIGPALSKFVNTFETGCEQMMQNEGANKLTSVASFSPSKKEGNQWGVDDKKTDATVPFFDKLSSYVVMTPIDESGDGWKNYECNTPSGTKLIISNTPYQLKDGSMIYLGINGTGALYEASGAYLGSVAFLLYDIDGTKGKNTISKDIFVFRVDNSGILVPYGGNAHRSMAPGNSLLGDCKNRETDWYSAAACTGAIADNGWKADYQ